MMVELINAVRLKDCLMVVGIGFIGFKYSGVQPEFLVLTTLFFICAVTMLQNGWRDRVHDVGKGKRFALENPKIFLFWLILFWIICLGLILVLFFIHPKTAGLFLLIALVGAIYSETRRVPLLPVTLVFLTSVVQFYSRSLLVPLFQVFRFSLWRLCL